MNRWIVYQRERFPLAAHAPLVAAFSASAVCFSSLVRGQIAAPPLSTLAVAFVTSLLFFLQLRIADEFKDFEDDSRHRPYRPVPRGLVTLRELAWIGGAAAGVQLLLALALDPTIVWLLAIAWVYLALMTREFFAPRWLKRHPVVYMTSHMAILPLVDLYATACDWWVAGHHRLPRGLYWFLIVSYLNGLVIEIGRKTRVPIDEEPASRPTARSGARAARFAPGCWRCWRPPWRRGAPPRASAPARPCSRCSPCSSSRARQPPLACIAAPPRAAARRSK
jgi:4-hydroxybenzoate polyprenyltransferase